MSLCHFIKLPSPSPPPGPPKIVTKSITIPPVPSALRIPWRSLSHFCEFNEIQHFPHTLFLLHFPVSSSSFLNSYFQHFVLIVIKFFLLLFCVKMNSHISDLFAYPDCSIQLYYYPKNFLKKRIISSRTNFYVGSFESISKCLDPTTSERWYIL